MIIYAVSEHYELSELYLKKEKALKHVEKFKKEFLKDHPTTYNSGNFSYRKTEDRDIPIGLEEIDVIE